MTIRRAEQTQQAVLPALVTANLSDLYRAFGIPTALYPLVTPLLWPFARRFALELRHCDHRTLEVGMRRAMAETLARFGVVLQTFGAERVPLTGPLLITANHPGLSDAPALLASLRRPDLRIVSAERDLLRALPTISARLIVIDGERPQRSVPQVLRHLRAGGAALTFPAGRIEPDPRLEPGAAAASLASWSRSVAVFAKHVPHTQIVPAVVSGVVTPETLAHPLTALHRDPKERVWLAASLQVMLRRYQHNHVTVRYGPPLTGSADVFAEVLRQSEKLIGLSGATQKGRNALQ